MRLKLVKISKLIRRHKLRSKYAKKKNVSTLLAKIFKLAENKAPIKAMWSY